MTSVANVEKAHTVVYHYTTQRGLEGILRSQSLHATHYKHLNDQSELSILKSKLEADFGPHIHEFAQRFAVEHPKFQTDVVDAGDLDSFVAAECANATRILYNVTLGVDRDRKYFDPYILSFCSHDSDYEKDNGLLSQWRGYGSGGGYAIVINTAGLVEAFTREATHSAFTSAFFGDIIYDDDAKGFDAEFGDLPGVCKCRGAL